MGYQERSRHLKETAKPREEWWSRVFATPVAHGILLGVADWRWITPNRLTLLSLATALVACLLITTGQKANFFIAAAVIQVSYILDCMDGQLARYRNASSRFGAFADKWSDHVKFPAILLALTIDAFHRDPSLTPVVLGFAAVFLVGYLPFLKWLASSELGIAPWSVLSNTGFVSRNLRFFLFEEAQWYLAVSVCLALQSSWAALLVIALSQGAVAFAQTVRILVVLHRSGES
jgi:phosphatidylglycerophosphate synthase